MAVNLPDLDYQYDALGRYISKDIMELHHSKHHQTYVDKLNEAFQKSDLEVDDANLATMLTHIDEQPESVRQALRNHGGGHYNHSLFWKWMSPDGGGSPTGQLASSINDKYGSYQKFVDEFTTKSLSVFGSGWCWLMPDMSIVTTANQDNPLMSSQKEPLLGLDVWEHAYYLDYKNKRDDYINAWWNVVNWDYVSSRLNSNNKD